jgi:O-antigen/teichoic acid export membrane protein
VNLSHAQMTAALAPKRPTTWATRFGTDTFWSTSGNVVMQGLSFCSTMIIARLLTKEEFGQYAVFLSSVALLGVFAGAGLGVAITTRTAELRDRAPQELGVILSAAYRSGGIVIIGLNGVVILAWAAVGNRVIQLKLDPLYVALVILTLSLNTMAMLQAAELNGYQGFRSLAIAQCIRGLALVPFCTIGALLFRLPGVIAAAAVVTGILMLMQAASLRTERTKRRIVVQGSPAWRELRGVLSDSIPAFLTNVANVAGPWLANVAVATYPAAGLAAVAEFGAASQVRNIVLFMPNIVGQVLMPTVANIKGAHDSKGWRLVWLSVAANTGAAIILAAAILIGRREISLLFGPAYAQAAPTVALVAVGGVIYVAQSTMCWALIGYGHIRRVCAASIIGAVTLVGTAVVLSRLYPTIGSQSLGWAFLAANAVQASVVSGLVVYSRSLRVAGSPKSSELYTCTGQRAEYLERAS